MSNKGANYSTKSRKSSQGPKKKNLGAKALKSTLNFEPNTYIHQNTDDNLLKPYTRQKLLNKQLTLNSNHDLPLKQESSHKPMKSYRVLNKSVIESSESRFSLLTSKKSGGLADDKSRFSDLQTPFNINVKKKSLSRSRSRSRPQTPNIYSNLANLSSNDIRDDLIKIQIFEPNSGSTGIKPFKDLIKKKSISRNDKKNKRSSSNNKLIISKETQCISEDFDSKHGNMNSKIDLNKRKGLRKTSTLEIPISNKGLVVGPKPKNVFSNKSFIDVNMKY